MVGSLRQLLSKAGGKPRGQRVKPWNEPSGPGSTPAGSIGKHRDKPRMPDFPRTADDVKQEVKNQVKERAVGAVPGAAYGAAGTTRDTED